MANKPQFGEPGHPSYYTGPLRTADEKRGNCQGGSYFSLGQATELYTPPKQHPRDGEDYQMAIGTLALNDGTWLAYQAGANPPPKHRGEVGTIGGFAVTARKFDTRDAALRSNAALILRITRHRFRLQPTDPTFTHRWKFDEPRYRQMVAWVYEVLDRPAPALFVAPPPEPVAPEPEVIVDKRGQLGFVL